MTTLVERFSLISQSILNRFTCDFAHTIRSRCGDCPEKFGEVWSSIPKVINVMHWNNTVSTSPERWKCGPSLKQHWGSALPPSYMCDWAVRTDKAGRQDWERNYQHYIDIGPISFFFFFFFFKIWYLAENKREKIAFAKYPLLREMENTLLSLFDDFWRLILTSKVVKRKMREMLRQSQWPQTHCLQCVFTDLWAFLLSFLSVFRWYLSQFSTDFYVILQALPATIAATALRSL